MSALAKIPLLLLAMPPKKSRADEIEEFMRKRPDKVTKLPPVPEAEDVPEVAETVDKTVIGTTWGTYRRRKHRGSDDQ